MKKTILLFTFTLTAFSNHSNTAWADPADYVKMPAIEYGERELETKYGTSKLCVFAFKY